MSQRSALQPTISQTEAISKLVLPLEGTIMSSYEKLFLFHDFVRASVVVVV